MRILYDARSVRTPAGVYVFRGLAEAWRDDPRVEGVYAGVPRQFDHSVLPHGVEPVTIDSPGWLRHVRRDLPAAADRIAADIIFCPNAIAPRDARSVLYFQDLFHFRPRVARRAKLIGIADRTVRAAWRAVSASSCRLAVAVSTEILGEIRKRVRVRSVMIPNGVDVGGARWVGDGDYVLVMGGIGPRKDEATALRAWARVPRSARDGLVMHLIGVEPAIRRDRLAALARSLSIADSVRIRGGVPRDVFLESAARARLTISCSRLEAFGLPVAEALAMGAPLVCSDIPAHRELLERAGAGATFAPRDTDDLARRICAALAGDGPRRLSAPPDGWAWRDRAREHLDAYEVAGNGT